MTSENIFLALAKYNSVRDENYLTEAFVFLLNSLLSTEQERHIAIDILNKLCVNDDDFSFDTGEFISISTQEVTKQGTPDIKIFTPDKLIYIEVKHDSPIGYKQISRYKKALESSAVGIRKIILLTRFDIDIKEEQEKPYKHVRWFEVYNWLDAAKDRIKDPINDYLIKSFNSFLEEKQMSIQKVGWEYINGIPAMMNLMSMLEASISGAGLQLYKSYPRATALNWRGFYIETNKMKCGVYFDDPLNIIFEILDKKNYDKIHLKKPSNPIDEDRWSIYFWFSLEDEHFFSLSKDEQLELITKFVRTAYADVQKMRVKE